MSEHLAGFPVVVEQAVVWGEMDAYRHVNNVVYFRYFENARLEFFRRVDWPAFEKETGIGPILHSTRARFRRALTYPDTILIGARVSQLGEDRLTLEHRIVSKASGAVVTEGEGVVVAFHYERAEKVALPEELLRRIRAL
jgi:acyl-CoA thioester hydrolase